MKSLHLNGINDYIEIPDEEEIEEEEQRILDACTQAEKDLAKAYKRLEESVERHIVREKIKEGKDPYPGVIY